MNAHTGFYHAQADEQKAEKQKPAGRVLWESRRAIVGRDLQHASALIVPVMSSDLETAVPRSTSYFEVPGGMKFFHGGATLQELIIPVVVVTWPAKARKVNVTYDELKHVTSLTPWVKVRAAGGQLFGATDSTVLSRAIRIVIKDAASGAVMFGRDEPVIVRSSGEEQTVRLALAKSKPNLESGAAMMLEIIDADDGESLAKEPLTLGVTIDEW